MGSPWRCTGSDVVTCCIHAIFAYSISAYKVLATQQVVAMQKKTPWARENLVLAALLKELRISVGLTQVQLATRTGLRQEDISKVENGVRQVGYFELRRWLAALSFDVQELDKELTKRLHQAGLLDSLTLI